MSRNYKQETGKKETQWTFKGAYLTNNQWSTNQYEKTVSHTADGKCNVKIFDKTKYWQVCGTKEFLYSLTVTIQ